MPAIPIYSHSPINAAKADGTTPQTAESGENNPAGWNHPPPTTTQPVLPGAPPTSKLYPPAQPGAVPALPAPTGTSSAEHQPSTIQPTPTQTLPETQGPPPPQPGAVPRPRGLSTGDPLPQNTSIGLPPPPRAGVSVNNANANTNTGGTTNTTSAATVTTTAAPAYPPQMNIPPPMGGSVALQGAQRGTTTTFVAAPSPLEHPPGYQQDVNAGELNRYQRAAQDALDEEERKMEGTIRRISMGAWDGAGLDGEGVWQGAKKMVAVAGEKLAAAEGEVWKRINNKD